jgi:hypothetical protein
MNKKLLLPTHLQEVVLEVGQADLSGDVRSPDLGLYIFRLIG